MSKLHLYQKNSPERGAAPWRLRAEVYSREGLIRLVMMVVEAMPDKIFHSRKNIPIIAISGDSRSKSMLVDVGMKTKLDECDALDMLEPLGKRESFLETQPSQAQDEYCYVFGSVDSKPALFGFDRKSKKTNAALLAAFNDVAGTLDPAPVGGAIFLSDKDLGSVLPSVRISLNTPNGERFDSWRKQVDIELYAPALKNSTKFAAMWARLGEAVQTRPVDAYFVPEGKTGPLCFTDAYVGADVDKEAKMLSFAFAEAAQLGIRREDVCMMAARAGDAGGVIKMANFLRYLLDEGSREYGSIVDTIAQSRTDQFMQAQIKGECPRLPDGLLIDGFARSAAMPDFIKKHMGRGASNKYELFYKALERDCVRLAGWMIRQAGVYLSEQQFGDFVLRGFETGKQPHERQSVPENLRDMGRKELLEEIENTLNNGRFEALKTQKIPALKGG